ncbi:unnamed protein product, partial [marine sediment metagenome]
MIPLERKIRIGKVKTQIIKRAGEKFREIDFDELMGVRYDGQFAISPAKIKKTPFWKTFGKDVEKVKPVLKKDFVT